MAMTPTKNVLLNSRFLNTYLDNKKITVIQFADLIGVAYSTVNRIMNGKRNPGSKFISGVLLAFPDLNFERVFYCVNELPNGNKKFK